MTKKIRFQTLDRGTGMPVAKRKPLVKTLGTSIAAEPDNMPVPKEDISDLPEMDLQAEIVRSSVSNTEVEPPADIPKTNAQLEPARIVKPYPRTSLERSFWWISALCLDFIFVGMSILALVIVPRILGLQSVGVFYEFAFWLAKINIFELLTLGFCSFVLYWLTFRWLAGETLGSMLFVKSPRN
jgi:hypothetical protein